MVFKCAHVRVVTKLDGRESDNILRCMLGLLIVTGREHRKASELPESCRLPVRDIAHALRLGNACMYLGLKYLLSEWVCAA